MDAVKRTQFCSGDIPAKDVSPKSNHEEHYTKSNWETVYKIPGLWSSKVSRSWTEGNIDRLLQTQEHLSHTQTWLVILNWFPGYKGINETVGEIWTGSEDEMAAMYQF